MEILGFKITKEDVREAKDWVEQEIRGRREDPFEKVVQFVKEHPGPVAACATGVITLVATATAPALVITAATAIGTGLTAEFIKSKMYAGRR